MYSKTVTIAILILGLVYEYEADHQIPRSDHPYTYLKDNIRIRARRSPQGEFKVTGTHNGDAGSLRGDLSGTLYKGDHSSLDGNAYYQRNWGAGVPKYQTGGGLNYNHDSGWYGKMNYDRAPGASSLGGAGGYKFYQSRDGSTSFGAEAFYNRNFGMGPKQDYGGSVILRKNF